MPEMTEYKGYKLGEFVKTKFDLTDENNNPIPAGTLIRLVAIAPKVRMMRKDQTHDGLPYFYNAILASQYGWRGFRIRADFCTIKPIEGGYPTESTPNGYTLAYNGFWNTWQVSHDEIGACIAEFDNPAEALEYCKKG